MGRQLSRINKKITFPLLLAGVLIGLYGCSPETRQQNETPIQAVEQSLSSTMEPAVFVHLFEWQWPDIALECERFLGPAGYAAVQISPPNEHIDHKSPLLSQFDYPWWARYQPVSFDLNSRSGSEQELRDMVQRCGQAGVDIYADVVVNHMADLADSGVAGTPFDRDTRSYRDYSEQDFHPVCVIQQEDYSASEDPEEQSARAERVRICQLGNLPDLDTGTQKVRDHIVSYIQKLADIGVKGFRIDAAKHMHPQDIEYIRSKLDPDLYFFLEIIDIGNQSVDATDYSHIGSVTELKYAHNISAIFGRQSLDELKTLGTADWYLPTDKAVVFIDNHDSQRGHGTPIDFSHRQGAVYELANIFMLAWPYGYPKVMSSYEWGGVDDSKGPPHDGAGNTLDVHNADGSINCFADMWICEHRLPAIAAMVKFRNHMQASGANNVQNWWTDGADRLAFSLYNQARGVGFVALNRGEGEFTANLQTGLPEGSYCNRLSPAESACDIEVDAQGNAQIRVPAMGAVALF